MKKFITLVLVLVLALGLAVPAMAFTSDTTEGEDHPFDLKIYLVEYDDNDLFGVAALPESDRGYAKNEIVAAIVELYVPKAEAPADDYGTLVFGGENVKLNVTDNDEDTAVVNNQLKAVNLPASTDTFKLNGDGDELSRDLASGNLYNKDKDKTYKWLFFAKVTDDEASLYAKLVDGAGSKGFETVGSLQTLTVTLEGDEYVITKHSIGTDDGYYQIACNGDTIKLFVDDDNKTTGMSIDPKDGTAGATFYDLGVNTKNELGVINPTSPAKFLDTDDHNYEAVMDVYNDVAVDVFGLDYMLIGNYLRDSFFKDLTSSDTIVATVDIEPWTAYVTVPDNIVVDPPKTGDAASIMGFVMVALSGAGVVALRKRG